MAEDEEGGIIANATTEATTLPKRTKKYIKKALRPNIHLGIHYTDLYIQYGPPALVNIMPEEKKHK